MSIPNPKNMHIPKLPKPVKTTVTVPGSKSYLNRALICATLSQGITMILNPNKCEDTEVLIQALKQLGVLTERYPDYLIVYGMAGEFKVPEQPIFTQNAGTATRFLIPHLPLGTELNGNEDMQKRPIIQLLQALEQIGYRFHCPTGCPPVKVMVKCIDGNHIQIDASVSSQFISSLMMLAPTLAQGLTLELKGKIVSRAYLEMTMEVMKAFGIKVVQAAPNVFKIKPKMYESGTYKVPADASSAVYWWTLAAMTQSQVDVSNIDLSLSQADLKYLDILKEMGCQVKGTKVTGPLKLKAVEADLGDFPDAALALAVLAAITPGTTTIKNVAHLKHKEVDRMKGIVDNLKRLGVSAQATENNIIIHGNDQISSAEIRTMNDHRFAMAFTILGMATGKVTLDNPDCVSKSYPNFYEDMQKILDHCQNQNIVITGMRCSGKSTLARMLGEQFDVSVTDLDDLLQTQTGMTITGMVEKYGWEYFRKKEHESFKNVMAKKNVIISTGGGTLIQEINQPLIKNDYVLLTDAPVDQIIEWTKKHALNDSSRPPLTEDIVKETKSIYNERKPVYLKSADTIYDSRDLN